MANVSQLRGSVTIDGIQGAVRDLGRLDDAQSKVVGSLNRSGGAASTAARALSAFGHSAAGAAKMATAGFALVGGVGIAGLAAAVGTAGFSFNNMQQQAQVAFTTMLGDAGKAKDFLADLSQFAATTPFELKGLISASQKMLAMGFTAEQVKPTLTAIGDAVAGLGGGAAEVDRVTTALGQIQAKGKASAEEMMQLTEAGIPAWQMLADKIGTSVPEAMDLVSRGAVDADTTIGAVVSGMQTKFGGMMAAQSQTFGGLLSTLKDTFSQVSGTVMAPFFEMATSGMQRLAEATASPAFQAGVQSVANGLREIVTQAVAFGAQVGPPILAALGAIVAWVQSNWPGIRDTLVNTFTTLAPIVSGAVGAILPVLQSVGALVAEHWGPIAATVGAVVAAFAGLSAIAGVIGGVVASIGAMGAASAAAGGPLTALVAVLGGPLTLAIGAVALGIGALVLAWTQNWGDIQGKTAAAWGAIQPVLQAIGDRLSEFGQMILPELVAAWESVKSGVEAAVNAIQAVVEPVFSAIAAFLSSHGAEIQQIAEAAWTYIQTTIDNILAVISNVIQLALNLIQGDWSGAWNNVKAIAGAIWDQIKAVVQLGVDAIPPLLRIGMDAAKTVMSAAWDAVKTVVSEAWDGIKTAISTGVSAAATLVGELPGKAKSALGDLLSALRQAGIDLIQGMINGITSMAKGVADAARDVVTGAVNAAKDALGIRSPSRVAFEQVGVPIGKGIAGGIASTAHLISFEAEAAALAGIAAARSAMAGGLSSMGGMGGFGGFDPVASGYTAMPGGGFQKRLPDGTLLLEYGGSLAPANWDAQVPGQPPGVTYWMLFGPGSGAKPAGSSGGGGSFGGSIGDPYSTIDADTAAFPNDTGTPRFSGPALAMLKRFGSGITVNITVQGNVVDHGQFAAELAPAISRAIAQQGGW